MTQRAVLFDAAGTLIRLGENVGSTYARLAASAGVDLPAGRITAAFSRVFRAAPPMVFTDLDLGETLVAEKDWWKQRVHETFRSADPTLGFSDFDGFFERLWTYFADPGNWRLAPGTRQALDSLHEEGFLLGVLSNFDHRLHGLLEGLGIRELFECVVLPADAGAAKPDPRIFRYALASLGVPARASVYVGDDPDDDLAGARGVEMPAIDVRQLATLAELPARVATLIPPQNGENP